MERVKGCRGSMGVKGQGEQRVEGCRGSKGTEGQGVQRLKGCRGSSGTGVKRYRQSRSAGL